MKFILLAILALPAFADMSFTWFPWPPHQCPVERSLECEEAVKSKIPRWERDEERELQYIQTACLGNREDKCVEKLVGDLAWYNTNNLRDMARVARSCGLSDVSCIDYVSSQLSRIDYSSLEDITAVAAACANADASCVEKTCSTSRTYDCKRKKDLLLAAKSCFKVCY